jgi:hypothetical protein
MDEYEELRPRDKWLLAGAIVVAATIFIVLLYLPR